MDKSITIVFGAVEDGDLNGFGDTFEFIAYRIYEGNKEVGYCNLMPNGDVNNGTQEGTLEDENSVDIFPIDEDVLYHNNEDGTTYTYDEFNNEFRNNPKWQLVGIHGYLETV